jgi:PAS domain S-box-containing protein
MTPDAGNVTRQNLGPAGPFWSRFPASITTLGFVRRLLVAFGLMVFIPLLVMVYVRLSGEEISFPLVLLSTAAVSIVGFSVVWEMVARVVSLLQDLRQLSPRDVPSDAAGVEHSISQLIQRMQTNMAELETKARMLDEAERRLGEANVYSAQIIAAIADFVFVTTPQLQVTKVNAVIQTALGYNVDELAGCAIETVLRRTDGGDALLTRAEMDQLTKSGALWGKSGMVRSRDGEGIPVQMNLSPVKDGDGRLIAIVIVARDVRETLRLLGDLQQAKAALEDRVKQRTIEVKQALSEREKATVELTRRDDQLIRQEKMASVGQLAAGVAHEINSPVGFVSRNLQVLQLNLADLAKYVERTNSLVERLAGGEPSASPAGDVRQLDAPADKAQFTHAIGEARRLVVESIGGLDRVKKLVAALSGFSQADQEEPAWADLNEGLESTINIVWNELKARTTLHRDYGDLPKVFCYPHQLNQVFMNLLVNAAQAIPERGDIWVKTWADTQNVYVDVRDTGTGIPEEHLSKIFAPFFTTKPDGQGTGLGLSVVCGIMSRHGGTVRVKSRVGEGTTVHLSVPVERSASVAA